MAQRIERVVLIDAPPETAWKALTVPSAMKRWMADPGMEVDVETDWVVGGPIVIKGSHHARFVNSGTVLHFEPGVMLRYSSLSSLSRLADVPENRSVLEFKLSPQGEHTSLTLTITGFPTETIFKHQDFYWAVTLGLLKRFVESGPALSP